MKITPNGSNQTILKLGSCEVLFSYETPVAGFNGSEWFSTEEKFSKTTSKHINKYLRERAVEWKVVPQHYVDWLLTDYVTELDGIQLCNYFQPCYNGYTEQKGKI